MIDNTELEKLLADPQLQQTPIRLAVNDAEGFPRIVPLWYNHQQGDFFSVTPQSAWLVQQLSNNPQVGFDISTNSPPYKGVRGAATATVTPLEGPLLEQLISGYLGNSDSDFAKWLLSRKEDEVVIKISPCKLSSWDYSQRMQGATANG